MSGKGGTQDRPGAEAGGCEGALAAVPGRGSSAGALHEQQEQERGESTAISAGEAAASLSPPKLQMSPL